MWDIFIYRFIYSSEGGSSTSSAVLVNKSEADDLDDDDFDIDLDDMDNLNEEELSKMVEKIKNKVWLKKNSRVYIKVLIENMYHKSPNIAQNVYKIVVIQKYSSIINLKL